VIKKALKIISREFSLEQLETKFTLTKMKKITSGTGL
jgi:hypothetical protein